MVLVHHQFPKLQKCPPFRTARFCGATPSSLLFSPFYAHSRRPKYKQTTSRTTAVDPFSPEISPPMAPAVAERIELAKLCSSKDWSKANRILDSLLAQSCAIQDLCNRAFCYSQLELHKHVVKDCDRALQLDPKLLQAYILKGCCFC